MTLSGTGFEDIYPSPDFLTHQHADKYDLSVSEYVKDLIEQGRGYDELADRLESHEDRIRELESHLCNLSNIYER